VIASHRENPIIETNEGRPQVAALLLSGNEWRRRESPIAWSDRDICLESLDTLIYNPRNHDVSNARGEGMRLRAVLKGLLTFVPGATRILPKGRTGGTDSALYCYEVWMKHLTMLHAHGMERVPRVLAELGPGDSLGIGIAALLSGVERYRAFDVVRYSDAEGNLPVFEELVRLFEKRTGRPSAGWPDYDRYLDGNLFPSHILTEPLLAASLSPERIGRIRNSILDTGSSRSMITYVVPWSSERVVERGSVDAVMSHAVLEHVADPDAAYRALAQWLRPGGMMSHQIDLTSHKITKQWNGHWAIPEPLWRVTIGRRTYLLNRMPCSIHIDLLHKHGFEIVHLMKNQRGVGIDRSRLSKRWRTLSDDDLSCSDLYLIAKKP
jgi:SAM-dependent methyltransferase